MLLQCQPGARGSRCDGFLATMLGAESATARGSTEPKRPDPEDERKPTMRYSGQNSSGRRYLMLALGMVVIAIIAILIYLLLF